MGLDMYLTATIHTSKWFLPEYVDEAGQLAEKMGLVIQDKRHPSFELSTTCLYWRKANAIHGWFVNQIQGGVDECQKSYVSREQLEQLRDLCKDVLNYRNKPEETPLKPTQGFFFGSAEVDEWYWQDIKRTVKELTHILDSEAMRYAEFTYQASW